MERIERQLLEKLQPEQDRPIAEYSFFNVLENSLLQSTTVNFSPLSAVPPKSDMPGLIGYFQVDPDGSFHIPALPELNAQLQTNLQSGLSADALATRIALKEKLRSLLAFNEPEEDEANVGKDKVGTKDLKKDNAMPQESRMQTKRFDENLKSGDRDQLSAIGASESKKLGEKTLSPAAPSPKSLTLSDEKLEQLNIETSLWKQKRKPNEASGYEL